VKYKDGSVAVAPQPSVIAQPSVVAGREHVTRIAYNELWQPTAITEEGFSPIDDKGQTSAQGAPISRTTTYKYTTIHGRTLLAEIDGPLPNGPKSSPMDSDVTRIAWDASGQPIKDIIYPANLQAHVEQDGLGRLKAVTGPSGLTDRYGYDERGELVAIEHRSGSTLIDGVAYRHDLLGRVTETLRIAGDK